MKLSVIIVNYNVKYFLEQCLYSVNKALSGIGAEVIVVDNNSVDGSEVMIRSWFPEIRLMVNHENIGFAKANNQAIRAAQGEYILLLNPDTVIEETTFSRCIAFMDSHPEAGALGPKMIDGKGRYLPESKRGLPTPEVAFYKIFGLTKLFPASPKFGKYYLGHTRNDVVQEVDILTGAFMFIRASVLSKTGLLDEDYFMYGEDIDMSYRILKAGYKVYYFPETTIIHYKGESTKKGSLNYILIFYKAMQIFATRHFSGKLARTYTLMINMAIYFRAVLSLFKRTLIKIIPAVFDLSIAFTGCHYLAVWWAGFYFKDPAHYSQDILNKIIPLFIILLLIVNLITGGYRSPFNLFRIVKGSVYGLILVLVVYALLPMEYRFSRAMIFIGTSWTLITLLSVRILLSLTGYNGYLLDLKKKRRIAIVGFEEETERIKKILEMSGIVAQHIVNIYPDRNPPSEYFSGTLFQLREILQIHHIDELIFCAKDISSQAIIDHMKTLTDARVDFKIASPGSPSVIGSNSTNSSGDLYIIKVNPFEI
jgi:O-antigen biosynthesis protein